jgi:2-C-methyl-D-erythritol 4-phosphate cytidylyltransferase
MHVAAIIVAAGAGRRIGGATPKSYLPIAGRPLILRTVDRIFSSQLVAEVILVVNADEIERCRHLLETDVALKGRPYVLQAGGATRQHSVRHGLQKISADTDVVMIHDGARPFVSAALIDLCIAAAAAHGAAVVGLPVRDTIKQVGKDGYVQSTPERAGLWEIQTPQIFQRELIVAAHDWAAREGVEATDDAMVVERMDKSVFVVAGERTNFKITVPEDLLLAEALIRAGVVT